LPEISHPHENPGSLTVKTIMIRMDSAGVNGLGKGASLSFHRLSCSVKSSPLSVSTLPIWIDPGISPPSLIFRKIPSSLMLVVSLPTHWDINAGIGYLWILADIFLKVIVRSPAALSSGCPVDFDQIIGYVLIGWRFRLAKSRKGEDQGERKCKK